MLLLEQLTPSGRDRLNLSFWQIHMLGRPAKVWDASGTILSHSGEGLGSLYIVRRRTTNFLLGELIELRRCCYVKAFQRSMFKCVNFGCYIPSMALGGEFSHKNLSKELGVIIVENF